MFRLDAKASGTTSDAYNFRMASASSSLPLPTASPSSPPSFWTRESPALRQGIKTGLAAAITYAIYAGWHLHQGYWAVFAALVVTQANLGASWKAALSRTVGSTAGAIAAALIFPVLGKGPVGAGVALFLLGSLFGYLTALSTAFTAAGVTAAIILIFGGTSEPWHTAWLRVLYTAEGAFVAFAVGFLLWPVRAREGLCEKIASVLDGAGELYRAVSEAAMRGVNDEETVRKLDRRLHDLRRGITQQMDEARSELAFSRFNQSGYQQVIDVADQLRRRLTAMAEDSALYVHAQIVPAMLPSLPKLVEQTALTFSDLAQAVRGRTVLPKAGDLNVAIRDLDADVGKLRAQRVTSPFTLDRMLPFWALVFNLREIAQDLKQLEQALTQLV